MYAAPAISKLRTAVAEVQQIACLLVCPGGQPLGKLVLYCHPECEILAAAATAALTDGVHGV
jgi:hypothetical protein